MSDTTYIPATLTAISMTAFEERFNIVRVFSRSEWEAMLDVPPSTIWVVLPVTDRKVLDGSDMVVATISPEFVTLFEDSDIVYYIQTAQEAATYKVEVTMADLARAGIDLSGEIKAALEVLDAMKADTSLPVHRRLPAKPLTRMQIAGITFRLGLRITLKGYQLAVPYLAAYGLGTLIGKAAAAAINRSVKES